MTHDSIETPFVNTDDTNSSTDDLFAGNEQKEESDVPVLQPEFQEMPYYAGPAVEMEAWTVPPPEAPFQPVIVRQDADKGTTKETGLLDGPGTDWASPYVSQLQNTTAVALFKVCLVVWAANAPGRAITQEEFVDLAEHVADVDPLTDEAGKKLISGVKRYLRYSAGLQPWALKTDATAKRLFGFVVCSGNKFELTEALVARKDAFKALIEKLPLRTSKGNGNTSSPPELLQAPRLTSFTL